MRLSNIAGEPLSGSVEASSPAVVAEASSVAAAVRGEAVVTRGARGGRDAGAEPIGDDAEAASGVRRDRRRSACGLKDRCHGRRAARELAM